MSHKRKNYNINRCENCSTIQKCNKKGNCSECDDYDPVNDLGYKPRKSKSLCVGCTDNYYNLNRKDGCYKYSGAYVASKLMPESPSHPPPWKAAWKLNCFMRQY